MSYRAAKAAQNQIVKTASLEIAWSHPQAIVVTLYPGTVATQLSQPFSRGHRTITPDDAAGRLLGVIEQLDVTQSGGFFAYDGEPIQW